jgi:N-glycosidase YbiA
MTIFFYHVEAAHGCFSNFSPHGFTLQGQIWFTAEHYYQAHKFWGTGQDELVVAIQQAATPTAAAALGRNPQYKLRPDWDLVKLEVMYKAVLAKFQAHADIREILLGTQDALIIEDSPVDAFWGCGSDRQGLNHLGKILMQVRQQLRQTPTGEELLTNG